MKSRLFTDGIITGTITATYKMSDEQEVSIVELESGEKCKVLRENLKPVDSNEEKQNDKIQSVKIGKLELYQLFHKLAYETLCECAKEEGVSEKILNNCVRFYMYIGKSIIAELFQDNLEKIELDKKTLFEVFRNVAFFNYLKNRDKELLDMYIVVMSEVHEELFEEMPMEKEEIESNKE